MVDLKKYSLSIFNFYTIEKIDSQKREKITKEFNDFKNFTLIKRYNLFDFYRGIFFKRKTLTFIFFIEKTVDKEDLAQGLLSLFSEKLEEKDEIYDFIILAKDNKSDMSFYSNKIAKAWVL